MSEVDRAALMDSLKSRAEARRVTNVVESKRAERVTAAVQNKPAVVKPAKVSVSDDKRDAEMVCLCCPTGSKPRKQRWLGEHLVNAHLVTLSDYLEAFYTPRTLSSVPVVEAIPAEKREEIIDSVSKKTTEPVDVTVKAESKETCKVKGPVPQVVDTYPENSSGSISEDVPVILDSAKADVSEEEVGSAPSEVSVSSLNSDDLFDE